MSVVAIKTYVQQQTALLDVPVTCEIFAQRPKEVEVGQNAIIVVNVPQSREKRLTMPRTYGQKVIEHQVSLVVYWVSDDEQTGGQYFDGLLWQIDHIFRTTAIQATITDPDNGEQSVLDFVGENIDTRVDAPEFAGEDQSVVVFAAEKVLLLSERLVG